MACRTDRVIGVLLSGGEGKRLWPLSTKLHPKQFLKLGNDNALFSETVRRNDPAVDSFVAVANKRYRFLIKRDFHASSAKPCRYIFESVGRNTAPAIAFAALACRGDDVLVAVPTDACIKDLGLYEQALQQGIAFARQGYIATFGIRPTHPHVGYGYIRHQGNQVLGFTEKPSFERAQAYVASGDYLWNSGIFVFQASVMLGEMRRHCPLLLARCAREFDRAAFAADDAMVLAEDDGQAIPEQSIDCAVIEKTHLLKVVPAGFYWSDLGSLEALADQFEPDGQMNRVSGANVVLHDCQGTQVINDGANNLVVALGLQDVVIANTNGVVLVSRQGASQEIKEVLGSQIEDMRGFVEENLWSARPWGFYEVLLNTPHYKIKRLTIEPGMRLSFQEHLHRTEFWVAVVGEGTVTVGDKTFRFATPQCTQIPAGTPHRIANTTNDTLRIIEIATGAEISEGDIVRFTDDVGREGATS